MKLALARSVAIAALIATMAACSGGTASGARTVTITHGAVTPSGTVAGAADGVGTVRLFHLVATVQGGATGTVDAMMTTLSVDQGAGTETRLGTFVFMFSGGADELILEGTTVYPTGSSTFKAASTVVRPVIGGSGAYAGARGWAESSGNADGTWAHVFHLLP